MTLAKTLSSPRKTFAVLAYMEVGQGRKQDAEALRLGERKKSFSCLISLGLDLANNIYSLTWSDDHSYTQPLSGLKRSPCCCSSCCSFSSIALFP